MAVNDMESGNKEERLKAALWYNVGKAVDAIAVDQDLNTSPYFIGGLSEMLWAQIELVSRDLESFAKHAGRSTINTDDVLLLARRNQGLHSILRKIAEDLKQQHSNG